MKSPLIILAIVACAAVVSQTAEAIPSVNLSSFGSTVTADNLTYNPATSTITGAENPGGLLYPDPWTPVDLTTLDNYAGPSSLLLNLTGFATAPTVGGFTITLEGGAGNYVATTFNWNSLNPSSSTVTVPVNTSLIPGGFQWNNIVGWTLDSGGSGNAVNATFTSLTATAVPSPTPEPTPTPPPPQTGGSFTARAPGGVRFLTGLDNAVGVTLTNGATSWESLSDRNAKAEPSPVDHRDVLRKVARMPVTSWQYKHDAGRQYIGPMAQDFHAAFGLGHDEKHISTLDTDGVALSAVQGLIAELQERKDRSAAQDLRLRELEAELQSLRERLAAQ